MTTEQSIRSAGQSTAGQSTYEVRFVYDVRIPTAEPGITLGANLYLPVTDEPVPAVVTILHNSKDGIAGIGGAPYLEYFASRGFASVLVDRLGTGTSDGHERPAFDPGDGDDGVAVVEWAAGEDWCNGRVGMWGLSYGAINTLRTASRRPPALRAIVPIMGMLDPERDFVHPIGERGALSYFGLAGVWNLFIQLQPPILADPTGDATRRWEERVRLFEPWLMDAWRLPPGDARWRDRVIDASTIEVPALCVAGWHDVFLDGTMRAYAQIPGPKRLVVGPWMHELPNESPREPVDVIELACDWWRRWLSDAAAEPTTVDEEPAVVHLGGGRGGWAEFPHWPPAAKPMALTTTADGGLREAGAVEGSMREAGAPDGPARFLRWATDRTVGALSGLGTIPLAGFGFPLDQHDDDCRSLSFTTDPLSGLVVAGTVTVDLVLGPRTTSTRCVARLSDVDTLGRSTLIAVGVGPVPPGGGTVTMRLNPAGYDVAPGHRLRLALSDSDLPRLWPAAADAHLDVAVAGGGTRIEVPVANPTRRITDLPGPADLPKPFSGEPPSRTWRIERDYATGAVTVTVGDAAGASLPLAGEEIRLERQVEIAVHIPAVDAAWLTGHGRLVVTSGGGRRTVVTARTRVDEQNVSASGEVQVDDEMLVNRRWSG